MLDGYDRLIGLIYDGASDEACWDPALKQIADVLGAAGVGLGMQDMRTNAFRNLGASGIDPDLNPTYQRLAPDNTIWREIARRREPLTDCMVMPKAAFVRTELYADWFRPQGFHGVMAFPTLFKESASAVVVAFRDRSLGDFESDDLAALGRFAGHFRRALTIRLDRERAAEELAAANLMLDDVPDAVLLIEHDLRLVHANAAARAMLEAGGAIRSHQGRLEFHDPEADAKLTRMAAGGRSVEFRFPGPGRTELTIRLGACAGGFGVAGGGYATVSIIDPNRRRERPTPLRLRNRLGLTRRQSEAIAELARGATEKEAAENLGLGAPTLHTHIRRAYEKLDLRSRTELVSLLARHGFETAGSRG
jgi:DNA-binding CsgD family transcriptional regulator/PAS domain-containing protein